MPKPKFYFLLLLTGCLLTGCTKPQSTTQGSATGASTPAPTVEKLPSSSSGSPASLSANDPAHERLIQLAGSGAKDCGSLKSVVPAEMTDASTCAENAFKGKTAFYVEYEMPGLIVGVAVNNQGKSYSVQSGVEGKGLTSAECPASLRVASSGRVSCYATGSSPMGPGMDSGNNPHGSIDAMPAGHPNLPPQ